MYCSQESYSGILSSYMFLYKVKGLLLLVAYQLIAVQNSYFFYNKSQSKSINKKTKELYRFYCIFMQFSSQIFVNFRQMNSFIKQIWLFLILEPIILFEKAVMNNSTPTKVSLNNSNISSDRTFKDSSFTSDNCEKLFIQHNYTNPSIAKSHTMKSGPVSKPSLNTPGYNLAQLTKTNSNLRNSSFFGNPLSYWEQKQNKGNRSFREGQNVPFLTLNINNSSRFGQEPVVDQIAEERRKSESINTKISAYPSFLKGKDQVFKENIKPNNTSDTNINQLRQIIDQIAARVTNTEQEICKLKQNYEKDKKNQPTEGDMKDYKRKLFQLAKFNSKHFTQCQNRIQEQQKLMHEVRQHILSFNGPEYIKKVNILEIKLHELYQGFKIKADHNQKYIQKGINKIRDEIRTEICNLSAKLNENTKDKCDIKQRLQKMQVDLKQKLLLNLNEYTKSSKICQNWKTIHRKELLIVKNDNHKEHPKSKFNNSPENSIYQTPTKENVDKPIRQSKFDNQIHEFLVKQQIYYIDFEGYLLDENKYYLLNYENQQIMIPISMIALLKENQILQI